MIPILSLHFKKPFARVNSDGIIVDALIVYGKRKEEIRPRQESGADFDRIWSQARYAYILVLDCYLVKLRFEYQGKKWHDA